MALVTEPDDVNFKTQLDEASLAKARDELGEKDKDIVNEVQAFRNLVLQEKWLRTPTELSFLLRFLRARKHSQLLAKETLENYWTIKTKCPEWFADIDPADKTLQELMRTCFYYSPLKRDSEGRRIVIEQIGNLNIDVVKKKYGIPNVFKVMVLVCDWLNRDENIQVNGLVGFIDCSNMTMKHHLNLMNMENGKKMMQFYQKSLPGRVKALHIYNEPPFFDAIWELFKPLMREKTLNRMHLNGRNMANVYDKIEMSMLPDEYLPDDYKGPSAGPAKQIVEEMIADMMKPEFREYIKDLSSSRYGVDLGQKKQSIPTVASFRKLNID